MINFPENFTATKLPGYFWNVVEKKLYSIKVSGELKEMKKSYPNSFNRIHCPGYYVSVKGNRKFLPIDHLQKLEITNSIIPIKGENNVV